MARHTRLTHPHLRSAADRLFALGMSVAVLLVCLALTATGVNWIIRDQRMEGQHQFDRYSEKLEGSIDERFQRVLNSLKGLRGYFVANGDFVQRDAFRIWVASRRIHEDMPGVRGLGFIQRVPRSDLSAFVEAERADNAPGFQVRPPLSDRAAHDDLLVIKFIEPLVHNERAWGYDIGSEQTRRAAAERAILSGQPALTARITLVQDGKRRPGHLYFLPVYRWASKIDTPQDRQRNLIGLIYAPIVTEEFLTGLAAVADKLIDVELYDGGIEALAHKVFDLGLSHDPRHPSFAAPMSPDQKHLAVRYERTRLMQVGGHALLIKVRSTLHFDRLHERGEAWWVGVAGTLLSLLAAVTIWLLIAGRARAEALAARMTERYQLAIDGGSDGLWDWLNIHEDRMWWSPQLYRMLGYEPDELPAGMALFEQILHADGHKEMARAAALALNTGSPLDATVRLRTKSGAYRWYRCRGKVFFDGQGRALRMAGSLHDVHERHLAEEVVQKHSEQLSAIFSLSPDGFVSFDANGQVNYASAAYGALTGLSVDAVLCLNEGEFLAQLLAQCEQPPDLHTLDDLPRKADQASAASWLSRHRLVLTLKAPAGRMLALSLYEAQGDTVSRLLLVRDVTHEAEVDRMKSSFLSMAAHELRTPMASIYGFVELLLQRDFKPDRQKDLLGRVYRQCEVMIAIINELLDLARIEHRRGADFECRQWDLQDVVNEVVRDFKPPPGREGPCFVARSSALPVLVDRQKLSQAVLNVLSNAYKYSPDGGTVKISFPHRLDEDGTACCGVCIEDDGIGMTDEQLTHMGERFYRADKSGSIPGTGLGLSIVKEIIELMSGSIEVRSQPGHGTAMTLWLPLQDRQALALPV